MQIAKGVGEYLGQAASFMTPLVVITMLALPTSSLALGQTLAEAICHAKKRHGSVEKELISREHRWADAVVRRGGIAAFN